VSGRRVPAAEENPLASLMAFVMAAVMVVVAVDDDVDWRFAGACKDLFIHRLSYVVHSPRSVVLIPWLCPGESAQRVFIC